MDEAAEGAPSRAGPGASLRQARESRQFSVKDVARELRLDARIIVALEADDYDALPAPIFIKGYLKAYTRLLGLSEQECVAAYERAVGGVTPPPLVISRGTGDDVDTHPARYNFMGWVLVLVVVVMGVLWWLARPPVVSAPVANMPPRVVLPAAPTQVEPATSEPTSVEPEAEVPAAEEQPAVEQIPGNLHVRMVFSEDCWTEVVDASGERLFFDLAVTGRTVEVEGRAPLQVFLGNAPGVRIEVNGRTFDHTRYNRSGNVARFRIGDDTTGNSP